MSNVKKELMLCNTQKGILFLFSIYCIYYCFYQLKYQKTEDETNELEDMTNLETVRVLEGVALQHGFVGRLVVVATSGSY